MYLKPRILSISGVTRWLKRDTIVLKGFDMNIEAKMTPRLIMTAKLVERCVCAADIGTDHAYVPIYLVKKGICEKAVAADISSGPLEYAKKNVVQSGLSDKIELVLSDGLKSVPQCEAYIIAGMGGELICSILRGRKIGMDSFVLQPQRSFDTLRRFLAENGFEITREALSREGGRMYCALAARFTGERFEISEAEALCGVSSVKSDPLFAEYMSYRANIAQNALAELVCGGGGGEQKKRLEREIEIYKNYAG